MRKFVVAVVMVGAVQSAQAADLSELSFLRGGLSEGIARPARTWDGFYAGGQFSYSAGTVDMSQAPASLTSFMLRDSVLQDPVSGLSVLPKNHTSGTGFGGFAGYNWQWEDAVLGVEVNYSNVQGFSTSAADSLSRSFVNPTGSSPPDGHTYTYNVTVGSNAAYTIKDVMTFRARAGWAAGAFMPYLFGGLAVGRVDSARSAMVSGTLDDYYVTSSTVNVSGTAVTVLTPTTTTSSLGTQMQSEARQNSYVGGYTFGLGTEFALIGNLFGRAEWEYVKFLKVKDMAASMNTVRVGVGYKF